MAPLDSSRVPSHWPSGPAEASHPCGGRGRSRRIPSSPSKGSFRRAGQHDEADSAGEAHDDPFSSLASLVFVFLPKPLCLWGVFWSQLHPSESLTRPWFSWWRNHPRMLIAASAPCCPGPLEPCTSHTQSGNGECR